MKIPQPIPYQGSKRNLAPTILSFFPSNINKLIEPFAGSAAISIATASNNLTNKFYINDINTPLMKLIENIIIDPLSIANSYTKLWYEQLDKEREYYNFIRDRFNEKQSPDDLLYLLARCVKAAVRYNSNGDFNQSPDHRRKGKNPKTMTDDILSVSALLKGKTKISSIHYSQVIEHIEENDLIYMDPPYQGVVGNRDSRYSSGIDFYEFIDFLDVLNKKDVMFILSYDGKTGNRNYGKELPESLELHKLIIDAGLSSQSTLLGKNEKTYEALYLSPCLKDRLNSNLQYQKNYSEEQQLLFV
jgi:DNA adenine methylase